jgi:hypothetical protein
MMNYPIYPSTKIAVPPTLYTDAVTALEGRPSIFFDGETILVPESQRQTIDLLIARFKGTVLEKTCGHEYEFATLAQSKGVTP